MMPLAHKWLWNYKIMVKRTLFYDLTKYEGSILCMHPANEWRHYTLTLFLTGGAYA